MDSSSL
ncbi:hypothetical protein MIMGU_mgv1a0029911mg, partial [Erythranthe guttata]